MARIEASLIGGYAVDVTAGVHAWRADEPEDVGGGNTGPDPYEILLGSLAACTIMTISMYCDRKGWKLEDVSASFEHDRVHADDCEECDDDRSGYIDRIRGEVVITGEFDDEQRTRLGEITRRCPVYKTLTKGVHIVEDVEIH